MSSGRFPCHSNYRLPVMVATFSGIQSGGDGSSREYNLTTYLILERPIGFDFSEILLDLLWRPNPRSTGHAVLVAKSLYQSTLL